MGQQEDFRTPVGAGDAAADTPPAPIFDELSARTAAPVVPLEKVARRDGFGRWAGRLRETARTPQFRRSWPLALLLVATLAAGVAALNIYDQGDATQTAAPAADAATAGAAADAGKAAAQPGREGIDNSHAARVTRPERGDSVAPGAATPGSAQAFAASALGALPGGAGDEQPDAAATGRDERSGARDKGKRQKRSKRRQGASRGGAVLFDVIR